VGMAPVLPMDVNNDNDLAPMMGNLTDQEQEMAKGTQ